MALTVEKYGKEFIGAVEFFGTRLKDAFDYQMEAKHE